MAKKAPKPKKPKPARGRGYGILNPYGDVWTYNIFDTPEAAEKHLRDFWRNVDNDLTRFRVIPVKVIVSAASEKGH